MGSEIDFRTCTQSSCLCVCSLCSGETISITYWGGAQGQHQVKSPCTPWKTGRVLQGRAWLSWASGASLRQVSEDFIREKEWEEWGKRVRSGHQDTKSKNRPLIHGKRIGGSPEQMKSEQVIGNYRWRSRKSSRAINESRPVTLHTRSTASSLFLQYDSEWVSGK